MFHNAESMSFHELGQHSFSGKDSTVKEQLLVFCSLMREQSWGWELFFCILFKVLLNARQCWKENSVSFYRK